MNREHGKVPRVLGEPIQAGMGSKAGCMQVAFTFRGIGAMGTLETVRKLLGGPGGESTIEVVLANCKAFLARVDEVQKTPIGKYRRPGETYWVNSSDFSVSDNRVRVFERVRGINRREFILSPGSRTPVINVMKKSRREESREMLIHGQLNALLANNTDKGNDLAIKNTQPATPFNGTAGDAKKWNRVVFQQPLPVSASEDLKLSSNGHSDIIARTRWGTYGLAVIEVKSDRSVESLVDTLKQALAYAECLRLLLERPDTGPVMRKMLGYQKKAAEIREIYALACVSELKVSPERIRRAEVALKSEGLDVDMRSRIRVHAGLYTYVNNGQNFRFLPHQEKRFF